MHVRVGPYGRERWRPPARRRGSAGALTLAAFGQSADTCPDFPHLRTFTQQRKGSQASARTADPPETLRRANSWPHDRVDDAARTI